MNDLRRANRLRFALPGLCLFASMTAAGCGSYGSVSGKISYKGEPLGGGKVLFFSEGNGTVSSPIGPAGDYNVVKAPTGLVKIAVETRSARPVAPPPGKMPAPPPGAIPKDAGAGIYGPASQPLGKFVPIPDSFADPNGSGLTYTVKSGPQLFDIELK